MLVPLSWLKQFTTWDCSLEQLIERITLAGLEVASVQRIGENWDRDRILVGQVVSVRQHPNADRLTLVTVNYGVDEALQVVTGAPNLHVGDAGQKVVFAMEGVTLRDGHAEGVKYSKLKRSRIRGVESSGMVCSELELGISEEHEGIMLLPDDAPVGTPFVDYYGDTVLEIDLTPNLARCFSILGVAREVAALTGGVFHPPAIEMRAEGAPIEGQVDIEIVDPDLCPRYSAALIRDVTIRPSPLWMQRQLSLAGQRPINNIVDITNYVMLELGQPLHAFDYDRLRPRKAGGSPAIIVRRAMSGEKMTTLDGVDHDLGPDMLMITDGGGPIGVAGVMGGLESEVTLETRNVLLEGASFNNISIRHTSSALKIASEAAQRFGRGVDAELTTTALRRAAELMRELGGGTIAQGFADEYPAPRPALRLALSEDQVRKALGISPTAAEIGAMLSPLGFECELDPLEPRRVLVAVPSFRLDVSIPADLIEEVARMYGYDRLPSTTMAEEMPTLSRNSDVSLQDRVRDILVGCGLDEIITYSMTNLASVAALAPHGAMPDASAYLQIANPLNRENAFMRQTLMNTSLETLASNLRNVPRAGLFEIARVYLPQQGQALPAEPRRLSIVLCGPRAQRSWLDSEPEAYDYYDLKGIVETLLARLGIDGACYEPAEHGTFQPGRAAALRLGDGSLGVLGEVHPAVREAFDLPEQAVCLAELDLEQLLAAADMGWRFTPVSRMPALNVDIALVVEHSVPSDAVEEAIRKAGGSLLVGVTLFDVYRGAQIGEGRKSLAYSLTFRAPDKTLTSEQANKQRDRIVQALREAYNAEIRG
ncbi:MAG: phenylalanine--tRNA ligase subunit beta [Anaerolineae bacterium]